MPIIRKSKGYPFPQKCFCGKHSVHTPMKIRVRPVQYKKYRESRRFPTAEKELLISDGYYSILADREVPVNKNLGAGRLFCGAFFDRKGKTGMKHTWMVATILLTCAALLTGCTITFVGGTPSTEPVTTDGGATTQAPSGTQESSATEGDSETNFLAALQSAIRASGCVVGIAHVDYIDSGLSDENAKIYLQHSELAEAYPFVKEISLAARKGIMLFVLVPADAQTRITVYAVEPNEQWEPETLRDEVIYAAEPGEPIALRCNENENYSNVLVSVTSGEQTVEFYPMISLEDGWSIALYEGCFDFSLRNIRKYLDSVTMLLPEYIPEIREALDRGYDMIFGGDFYFRDQMMLRFELGRYTDYEEGSGAAGFVCEKQYAVSFDTTYAKIQGDDNWYEVGPGVDGMGLE